MITGSQIRAARGLLNWTAVELAEKAGMSRNTINRLEAKDGIPPSRTHSLQDIKEVFEKAGIEFIDDNDTGGVGVRFRRQP